MIVLNIIFKYPQKSEIQNFCAGPGFFLETLFKLSYNVDPALCCQSCYFVSPSICYRTCSNKTEVTY